MASALVLTLVLLSLCSCRTNDKARSAIAEANPLDSGYYHIEISGNNGIALFAYRSNVLHLQDATQWDGLATIGAYGLAFQQECQSVYSTQGQAKLWRGLWVQSSTTTPAIQITQWLQEVREGGGTFARDEVPANTLLPLSADSQRRIITVKLPNAHIDWSALCDAHIDTSFGSQSFLTDANIGTVTLCFDSHSYVLIGVVITANHGQTKLSCTVTVSTADGHALQNIPDFTTIISDTVTEKNLCEEWNLVG